MTLLPSVFVPATVPKGHMYHTQTTPPRSLSVPARPVRASASGSLHSGSTSPLSQSVTGSGGILKSIAQTGSVSAKMIATASALDLASSESRILVGTGRGRDEPGMPPHHDPVDLPTRGHAASDFVYRSWHADEWSHSRLRTEWMEKTDRRHKGEIRNIRVLGIIGECLVVAYQGQGILHTFVDNGSTMELPLVEPPPNSQKKYRKHVDSHNLSYHFASYPKPNLPANIHVWGHSLPDGSGLYAKPSREACVKARVAVSGHVTHCHTHLCGT
eukprot:TRINITY_DN65552_c0_g1_i1.p1 TRINITY_DN65552_c0_g1~~TRINITY_DN65552_c0_g1_i1.p1  ORF type:complete len:304 (-),score=36.94 TRINITY_DN65552_c0_g1_i1:119-934(-)